MRPVDLTGKRIGRFLLLERFVKKGRSYYRCLCDCGVEKVVSYFNLTGDKTSERSCGCLKKELLSINKTKPLKEVIVKQILSYYKRNAKSRNISWEISDKIFEDLIFSPCHYCGIVGGTTTKTTWSSLGGPLRTMDNNGVDRFDNAIGYTVNNCVPACKKCNSAKNNMNFKDFLKWARRLVEYQNGVVI